MHTEILTSQERGQNGIHSRNGLPAGREYNVLVVDDDEAVRELMAMVLEAEGYSVLRARHSVDALSIQAEYAGTIHLLLTDFSMKPFENGFDLARQVRLARPGIRVVYVSGFVEHNVLQDEIESSRAGFLAKPFSPVSLLNCVRAALGSPAQIA
jgi:two-component system, cell cycle sensor histidine kinase and response regulator CckA